MCDLKTQETIGYQRFGSSLLHELEENNAGAFAVFFRELWGGSRLSVDVMTQLLGASFVFLARCSGKREGSHLSRSEIGN